MEMTVTLVVYVPISNRQAKVQNTQRKSLVYLDVTILLNILLK